MSRNVPTSQLAERQFKDNGIWIFWILIAFVFRIAGGPTANISYILIAVYALLGRAQAIQALVLSWLFTMLNPGLAPEASAASIGRYSVIFAAAMIVILYSSLEKRNRASNYILSLTIGLSALLLIHSVLFSAIVDVSVLKVASWCIVTLTLLSAWQGMSLYQRNVLFLQIHRGLIALLLFSIPLLAVPSIGYMVNGTGFQGALNHPQAFGPTAAITGTMVGAKLLSTNRPLWRDVVIFFMTLVMIVLSESRTAGLAMFLGLTISALLSHSFAGINLTQMLPGLKTKRLKVIGFVFSLILVMASPVLISFLYKNGRSEANDLVGAADVSRGLLVLNMMENIYENPWSGIGFGIGSNASEMIIERDAVFGIPLGAPIEKGVMPIAIIEEMGVIVGGFIMLWIIYILRRSALSGFPQFAVIATLLLVNLGEYMFFSVGGMGMLLLVILTGAVFTGTLFKGD